MSITIKILLVDDEVDFFTIVQGFFSKQIASGEFSFLFAENGLQALDILEANPDIQLILTDINMPVMNGLDFLGKLAEKNHSAKAIVISAYNDMKNIRTAMNYGAIDFITKPVDFADLLTTIHKVYKTYCVHQEMTQLKEQEALTKSQLTLAKAIQTDLLPEVPLVFDFKNQHYEFHGLTIPSKIIGGDYFDIFKIDETHVFFLIADGAGKGMSAALFMAVIRTSFRLIAPLSPAEYLTEIHKSLQRTNKSLMFATIFCGILNLETNEIIYSNAAHPPPLLVNANGIQYLPQVSSSPIGLPLSVTKIENLYENYKIILEHNTSLFMYTDGLTEVANQKHELFSEKRLCEILKSIQDAEPDKVIHTVCAEMQNFIQGTEPSDDVTVLCLKRT